MSDAAENDAVAAPPRQRRSHHRLALVLIAVAAVLLFVAIFAVWANRQLLNTENWANTSSELIENDAIRAQVADFLVDELYVSVDVQASVEQALGQVFQPSTASTLAGPAASGLRTVADRGVNELLGRPVPQKLWEEANRRSHARFIDVIEGGGDVLATTDGNVTLDLSSLLSETESNLGVGGRIAERLPEGAGQLVLFKSDKLELAQDVVRFLKAIAIVLVALSLALFILAVYLGRDRRRELLRACGLALLFAGAGALLVRSLAGDAVVDALAGTEAVRPAVEATWTIGTSLLEDVASATLIYGVFTVFAAWLAGPTAWAVGARRGLAPYLREPRFAWGGLALLLLLLFAWAPTPGFRLVVPSLILIALLAWAVAALRRQTMREFPDADHRESNARLHAWVTGLGRRGGRRAATLPPSPADARLDQLERLGRMRDSGLLEPSEYSAEKARVLAGDAPRPA